MFIINLQRPIDLAAFFPFLKEYTPNNISKERFEMKESMILKS